MPKPDKSAQAIANDPKGPVSSITEAKKVEKRVAIAAKVVYEAVRLEGEDELERPTAALAWSGFAAGLSMGFSLLAEAALRSYLPETQWRDLIARSGYSIGFLVVILGRQQLFTENTLTVVLPLLLHKKMQVLMNVLRLWVVVLTTNIIGTFLFALTIAKVHFLEASIQQSVLQTAMAHIGPSFWITFVRAIFAGWLIALMVWMLPDAASSRVVVIILITYLIGISHLSHIIAGSASVFYLVASGHLSIADYVLRFFVPTLSGNIIGGTSLVAALAHAQVVGGKD